MDTSQKRMLKSSDEQIRARQELRRSGASGAHDSRPNRRRTRKTERDAAIRASQN